MRPYLLLFSLVLVCGYLHSQVTTNFNNTERVAANGRFNRNYTSVVDFEVPAQDIKQLIARENAENVGTHVKPLQIAVPIAVDLDLPNQIRWMVNDGIAYGRYTIRLNGALSASVNFDRFHLPKGAELYVYNENGEMITGPVTEAENNAAGNWGSWVYRGGYITIEIKTPAESVHDLQLHVNNVAYGYKHIYKVEFFGQSGPCNVNVLCPLGNGWEGERNAVGYRLNAAGTSLCSGSMVMNACGNNTPFFLTAQHCSDGNELGWRITFQAWSPTCSPSQNATGITFNGSTFRASDGNTDFCLVQLNNTPPLNSNIHYAGWTRSTTPALNATGIHHPSGDVMKISRGNNPVFVSSYAGRTDQLWRVDWSPVDNGAGQTVTAVTEGGSSGSPLFDQNHRIIGQLLGGPSFCNGPELWDFYGRFDLSWEGNGAPATRLKDWLDPLGTNAQTTNTTNIANLKGASVVSTLSGPSQFCTSQTYTITGVPVNTPVCWSVSNPAVVSLSQAGCGNATSTTLTKLADGKVTLTATVDICPVPKTYSIDIAVGVPERPHVYDEFGEEITTFVDCPGVITICPDDDPIYNISNWIWEKGAGNFTLHASGNRCASVSSPRTGSGFVTARAANSCGSSMLSFFVIRFEECLASQQNKFKLYPNPASNTVTISVDPKKQATIEADAKAPGALQIDEVKIFDSFGALKYKRTFNKQASVTLDVNGLKQGVYQVEIKTANGVENQKLLIQK